MGRILGGSNVMRMFSNFERFPLKIVPCLEGWKCFMTELSPCDTPNFLEEITDRTGILGKNQPKCSMGLEYLPTFLVDIYGPW